MCGIAGILHRDGRPASAAIIEKMTDLLAHRGLDGQRYFCNAPIALGHRRLSIIDLTEASRQPMASKDGRFVITYNGEIYNFRELRAELSARGHPFESTGDTDVLLAAISEWGLDAIQRLNGMFAFGVWDGRERTLTIVRDRFGVKPVYYAQVDGALLFASEIKAFRAYPSFRTRMDVEGLSDYLSFQNFFTDRTLFDGVRLLPAGCYLQVALDADGPLKVHRYWDFHFQEPDGPFDEAAAIEELDFLFGQAVSR
jgi:asparagine synthase (glutamine-hydrolysing)